MLTQFSRTQLIYGPEAMTRLSQSRVLVIGIGGVGGYAVEALARSGVGTLDLVDDDRICLTNLNRQLYATYSTIGRYKVEVARERVKDICPDTTVNIYPCCRAYRVRASFTAFKTASEQSVAPETASIPSPNASVSDLPINWLRKAFAFTWLT